MIQLHSLTKVFTKGGRRATAIDSLDISIARGEIFGLLGPNGAGKTTTVKIISTLITPTSGTAIVNGHDIRTEEAAVRSSMGVSVGGERSFYYRLSGFQNLEFFGALQGLSGRTLRARVDTVMSILNLEEYRKMKFMKYSSGMKHKLNIARAILRDSPIYMFDEPTSGIDPRSAVHIRSLLMSLRDSGKTILLATHNMYEAEELCDRIAIMDKGKLLVVADPKTLKDRNGNCIVQIRTDVQSTFQLEQCMSGLPCVGRILTNHDGWVSIETQKKADLINYMYRCLAEHGMQIYDLIIKERNLEDVFLKMTRERE